MRADKLYGKSYKTGKPVTFTFANEKIKKIFYDKLDKDLGIIRCSKCEKVVKKRCEMDNRLIKNGEVFCYECYPYEKEK